MPLTDYECRRRISLWIQSNEKMTMTSIEQTLAMEGIHTSWQTVKNTITRWQKTGDVRDYPRRCRQGSIQSELGWSFTTARYCQAIHEANKSKRLDWCTERIKTFGDVIFTDESTVQLECHRRKCFREKMLSKLKYKHKHPPKVHV